MKLTIGDIQFSESGYASATVDVGTGTLPFLLFSICRMDVSVPLVEGKALEQYKDELLEKARERITEIYKEIVCGDAQSNNDLEGRVAVLEKRLGEQTSPDMLKHDGTVRLQVGECDEYSVGFPFRITEKCGQLFVHDEEGVRPPTHKHRDAIIDRVIRDLKSENGNMLKRLGRCMGLLQVAAEIEAVSQMCESKCDRCRESILSDFDNPPFKNVPTGWISPGVKYLKRRI